MKTILKTAVFILGLTPLWALADIDENNKKMALKGDKAALSVLESCAQNNDAECQGLLGYMYLNGSGVTQNNTLAAQWLEKSAYFNNAKAQFFLASMYEQNLIPNGDINSAIKWYERSANLGYGKSSNNLGYLYYAGKHNLELGLSSAQSISRAMDWYTLSAKQNDQKALAWFNDESAKNVAIVQLGLSELYLNGYGVPQDQKLADYWYRRAIDNGVTSASAALAEYFEDKKDYAQAMKFYTKSAEAGFPHAFNKVGYLYEKGLGVEQNFSEAMTWYKKAASEGDAVAFYNMGNLYGTGRGVKKDYVSAYKCFSIASKRNVLGAQTQLNELKKLMWKIQIDKAETELAQDAPPEASVTP